MDFQNILKLKFFQKYGFFKLVKFHNATIIMLQDHQSESAERYPTINQIVAITLLLGHNNITFLSAMPMGQMPVLEVNGKRVHQSISMAEFLGKTVGLGGNDPWEDLQIESVVNTINDFRLSMKFRFK